MVCVPLQEWSLENALDKMQAEWAGLCFETLPWRATGCTILRAVDDIQQVRLAGSSCTHE
jgi:dynein heavy chain